MVAVIEASTPHSTDTLPELPKDLVGLGGREELAIAEKVEVDRQAELVAAVRLAVALALSGGTENPGVTVGVTQGYFKPQLVRFGEELSEAVGE